MSDETRRACVFAPSTANVAMEITNEPMGITGLGHKRTPVNEEYQVNRRTSPRDLLPKASDMLPCPRIILPVSISSN